MFAETKSMRPTFASFLFLIALSARVLCDGIIDDDLDRSGRSGERIPSKNGDLLTRLTRRDLFPLHETRDNDNSLENDDATASRPSVRAARDIGLSLVLPGIIETARPIGYPALTGMQYPAYPGIYSPNIYTQEPVLTTLVKRSIRGRPDDNEGHDEAHFRMRREASQVPDAEDDAADRDATLTRLTRQIGYMGIPRPLGGFGGYRRPLGGIRVTGFIGGGRPLRRPYGGYYGSSYY